MLYSVARRTPGGQAPASAPNCRFSIDPPEAGLIDGGGSCHTTLLTIVNWQPEIKTLVFNDLTANYSHLLCFHIHSRLALSFPHLSFVFNNIPASFRQKKEFFLAEADFLSS